MRITFEELAETLFAHDRELAKQANLKAMQELSAYRQEALDLFCTGSDEKETLASALKASGYTFLLNTNPDLDAFDFSILDKNEVFKVCITRTNLHDVDRTPMWIIRNLTNYRRSVEMSDYKEIVAAIQYCLSIPAPTTETTFIPESSLSAFPFTFNENDDYKVGFTKRELACILLKVPDSGSPWIDETIRKSINQDF